MGNGTHSMRSWVHFHLLECGFEQSFITSEKKVKVGDLIKFRNLDPAWGHVGLIIGIENFPRLNISYIHMITKTSTVCTIPWHLRNTYIEKVLE